jgi:hypothetical protein
MKSRRGLSTVIGAVFFVIAATTIVTYISYSMNLIDEFAQSVIVSEAENINRGMEDISISQATIVGGEFNATVINTGSLSVQITRLWVVDEDSGLNSKADLDVRINPGNQQYNIGQSTGILADSTTSYTLKVVTNRGNIATFSVSPDSSTQIQIIVPAEVSPSEVFTVVSTITNNSTLPNNIANLVPTITNNATLTQVEAITPASIAVLPQGNTATFTSSWIAPDSPIPIRFNASYTGAPQGSWTTANMSAAISSEAVVATQSQWSQAASRVGILISGIPNPISSHVDLEYGKWGIGIINPLNRDVEIYAVGILTSNPGLINSISEVEPTTGWSIKNLGASASMLVWEGGDDPVLVDKKSIGQFRIQTDFKSQNLYENIITIQALTSEGKLYTQYTVASDDSHPLINAFYTTDVADPTANWTYVLEGIPGNTVGQIFNTTIQNTAKNTNMFSKVKLLILIPSDFTNVLDVTNGTGGWDQAEIVENPDKSHVIKVQTTVALFAKITSKTYQFSADTPLVNDDKLYVFQTTTIYPTFNSTGQTQLASALSEAGVEVVP